MKTVKRSTYLTWRDAVATVFVAGAVALYVVWATDTLLRGISTRVVAAIIFGLGWAGCTANSAELASLYGAGTHRPPPVLYTVGASLIGFATLVTGVTTLVSGSERMLTAHVVGMLGLWLMATVRHAVGDRAEHREDVAREQLSTAA